MGWSQEDLKLLCKRWRPGGISRCQTWDVQNKGSYCWYFVICKMWFSNVCLIWCHAVLTRRWTGLPWGASTRTKHFLWVNRHKKGQLSPRFLFASLFWVWSSKIWLLNCFCILLPIRSSSCSQDLDYSHKVLIEVCCIFGFGVGKKRNHQTLYLWSVALTTVPCTRHEI